MAPNNQKRGKNVSDKQQAIHWNKCLCSLYLLALADFHAGILFFAQSLLISDGLLLECNKSNYSKEGLYLTALKNLFYFSNFTDHIISFLRRSSHLISSFFLVSRRLLNLTIAHINADI